MVPKDAVIPIRGRNEDDPGPDDRTGDCPATGGVQAWTAGWDTVQATQ